MAGGVGVLHVARCLCESLAVTDPHRLLASGRDGDILEYGPGLVLRRARAGRSIEREAHVMEYAARHGYPVPQVHDVRAGGTEIVMERLDGPMMMNVMATRPWTMATNAKLLAELHDQLHLIAAPDWLPQLDDDGDRLVHLDLHPMNVMMTARGPVVIDWSNAARGDPLFDVAATYVLLTCPRAPMPAVARPLVQPVRNLIAHRFAQRYRGPELDARIADAADLKTLDMNMLPDEIENCRRLAARMRDR
jgi:aminoglycoside phosphotransferase (APT) family kinase protein